MTSFFRHRYSGSPTRRRHSAHDEPNGASVPIDDHGRIADCFLAFVINELEFPQVCPPSLERLSSKSFFAQIGAARFPAFAKGKQRPTGRRGQGRDTEGVIAFLPADENIALKNTAGAVSLADARSDSSPAGLLVGRKMIQPTNPRQKTLRMCHFRFMCCLPFQKSGPALTMTALSILEAVRTAIRKDPLRGLSWETGGFDNLPNGQVSKAELAVKVLRHAPNCLRSLFLAPRRLILKKGNVT